MPWSNSLAPRIDRRLTLVLPRRRNFARLEAWRVFRKALGQSRPRQAAPCCPSSAQPNVPASRLPSRPLTSTKTSCEKRLDKTCLQDASTSRLQAGHSPAALNLVRSASHQHDRPLARITQMPSAFEQVLSLPRRRSSDSEIRPADAIIVSSASTSIMALFCGTQPAGDMWGGENGA